MNKIDENKIIPIIRQNGTYSVPTFLKTKLFIDFSKEDDFEYSFDDLIRKLHKSPIFTKPKIGNNPFSALNNVQPKPKHDALKSLMKIVVTDYEKGAEYSKYATIKLTLNVSRIMLDVLISQAKAKKYVRQDNEKDLWLLDAGKLYALQNELIK